MKFSAFLVCSFAVLPIACTKPALETTGSGLHFRILEKGKGALIAGGATVKLAITRTFKDSVVFATGNLMPLYVQLIPGLFGPYGPEEVLNYQVHEGDSIQIFQRADSMLAKGILKKPLRQGIQPSDEWVTGIRVLKVYNMDLLHSNKRDSLIQADKQQEQLKLDSFYTIQGQKNIAAFLSSHQIPQNPLIDTVGIANKTAKTAKMVAIKIMSLDGKQLFFSTDSLRFQNGRSGLPAPVDSLINQSPAGTVFRYWLSTMQAFGSSSPAGIPGYSDLLFWVRVH